MLSEHGNGLAAGWDRIMPLPAAVWFDCAWILSVLIISTPLGMLNGWAPCCCMRILQDTV